jgi:hypothetical protein
MNPMIRSAFLLAALALSACAGVVVEEPAPAPAELGAAGAPAEEPSADACAVGDDVGTVTESANDRPECARMATRKGDPARWCCVPAAR